MSQLANREPSGLFLLATWTQIWHALLVQASLVNSVAFPVCRLAQSFLLDFMSS